MTLLSWAVLFLLVAIGVQCASFGPEGVELAQTACIIDPLTPQSFGDLTGSVNPETSRFRDVSVSDLTRQSKSSSYIETDVESIRRMVHLDLLFQLKQTGNYSEQDAQIIVEQKWNKIHKNYLKTGHVEFEFLSPKPFTWNGNKESHPDYYENHDCGFFSSCWMS